MFSRPVMQPKSPRAIQQKTRAALPLQKKGNEMARSIPFFPRFPCVLVRTPNQKRCFSVFKVSLYIMCGSDSDLAVVEIRKPQKELHLSGAPD